MMLLVFAKSHVKGHYRTDPTTHEQVYVKPHEDGRKASSEPFRMWRVQGGTIRHAVPGQSITPQQAEQLIEKMKRAGMDGEFIHGRKSSNSGFNIYVSGVSRSALNDFWLKHGSAAVQADKQAKIKADVQERKDRHKRELAEGLDKVGPAASWISETFGVHAMNDYNRLQLAKYLAGEDKKFNGMANNSWREGLEKLGALENNHIDFEKIKQAFSSSQRVSGESEGPKDQRDYKIHDKPKVMTHTEYLNHLKSGRIEYIDDKPLIRADEVKQLARGAVISKKYHPVKFSQGSGRTAGQVEADVEMYGERARASDWPLTAYREGLAESMDYLEALQKYPHASFESYNGKTKEDPPVGEEIPRVYVDRLRPNNSAAVSRESSGSQLSLFKAIRSKLAFWFCQTFAKSHVKQYTRADGTARASDWPLTAYREGLAESMDYLEALQKYPHASFESYNGKTKEDPPVGEEIPRVYVDRLRPNNSAAVSRESSGSQLSLFKAIRSKLAFWFCQTFAKSHVKQYTRADGTIVREHDDKRIKKPGEAKNPRGPAKQKEKKGPRPGSAQDEPKPHMTEQPEYPTVEPAKDGELASWLENIMQEPDIQAAMEEVKSSTPTDQIYKNAETGEYHPDRAKLHEAIVASMLNPKAVPEQGQRPHAMIFMGRPASGKTSALQPAAKELGVEFTVINADDIKEKLPEYNGRNAGVVHEESSDIAEKQLFTKALESGHHVLLDVTGGNAKKLKKWVEHFHTLGYEISIMMAELPIEKCCARAVNRFRHTGRFVPPNYIANDVDGKPERTYDELKSDPRVSHWRRYSTDVEKGEKTPLREQGSKEVSGNPFIKGGPFEYGQSVLGGSDGEGIPRHGREPERSDYRDLGKVRQVQAKTAIDHPALARAYQLRDALTKSIHHYSIDLESPEIAPDVRGTLLAARHKQSTRLEQLNDMIAKVEA